MRRKSLLDSIEVPVSCSQSWDQMQGTDEVRFCSHCAKNVHNLSAMTRRNVQKLIAESNGQLCVRYITRPDGRVQTVDRPLYQIKRTARIAAGVLGATLSLSSLAYTQGAEPNEKTAKSVKVSHDRDTIDMAGASISGKVLDPNRGPVPGAQLTLLDTKTGAVRTTVSNKDGIYEFKGVTPSIYEITAAESGFKTLKMGKIEIKPGDKSLKEIELVMEIGVVMGACIVISYDVELIQAAAIRDKAEVLRLLAGGKDVNEREKPELNGTNALEVAASSGNLEIVQILLKAKAQVNVTDAIGWTPLMIAARNGYPEIVKVLLKAGANPNLKNNDGKTAYDLTGNEEIKRLLNRFKPAAK